MRVRVINKKLFSGILKKGKKLTVASLEKKLASFVERDSTLELSSTSFSNDVNKHSALTPDVISAIIYLVLEDHKVKQVKHYSLEDFQKIFAHLELNDLKLLGNTKRESYNQLISSLISDNDNFNGIYLNEKWEVAGGNSVDIDAYKSLIYGDKRDEIKKEESRTETLLNIKENGSFFQKYRTLLAYIFGFLFNWLALISFPIIAIGLYRTKKEIKLRKVRKRRYLLFGLMCLMYLITNVFILPKILDSVLSNSINNNLGLKQNAFETQFNSLGGNGFVTIYNNSLSKKGKNLGKTRTTTAKIGDTILVTILIANTSKSPLENVKAELSPRTSGLNKKHTFFGTLNAFNAQKVIGSCYLSTYENTRLRSLNKAYIQKDNAKSLVETISKSEFHSLYNGGYTIGRLFPGSENYIVITSKYVVEGNSPSKEKIGFDPDPLLTNIGFLTVNDERCSTDCANDMDIVTIPDLRIGERFNFSGYINYHNWGSFNIENARGTLYVEYDETNRQLIITAELFADNVPSIYDTARVVNLPEHGEIEFVHGVLQNRHGTTDNKCKGYDHLINFSEEQLAEGISLDVLDIYNNGWCDQGYIICKYSIIRFEEERS